VGPVLIEWSGGLSGHTGRSFSDPSFSQSELSAQVGLGPALYFGRLRTALSLEIGAAGIQQSGTPGIPVRLGVVPLAALAADADVRVSSHFGVAVSGWAGPVRIPLDTQGAELRLRAGLGLGLCWRQ
jgi:hypothetical protein